jgi:hypothetical protein
LDQEQRAVVQRLIESYQRLRELIPGAHLYHLQPPLAAPALGTLGSVPVSGPVVQDWFALQYLHPDLGRGALLVARNDGERDAVTLKLRGLAPQTPYDVAWSDGRRVAQELGETLAQTGVVISRPPYSGGLLWITPLG